MAFQPVFNEIDLTLKRAGAKERTKIECRTEILSESVSKILNLYAKPIVTKTESLEKGVKYVGRINFFICYIDDDGEICKGECATDFSGTILVDGNKNCAKPVINCVADKIEADVSGTKLAVSAMIDLEIDACEVKKVSALVGGDDLIVNSKEVALCKSCGARETVFPVEEEFEIDTCVKEVLSQRADAVITSAQSGVGCIVVEGQIYLSAILLQTDNKKGIIRENKTLPFRAEIECEDAMPSMTATATVKEKSFKTDISVDTENGKSRVSASIALLLQGEVFYTDTLNLVSDAFSLTEKVEIESEEHAFCSPCPPINVQKQIGGVSSIDELPVGVTMLAVTNEKIEVAECEAADDLSVSGTLFMTVFFKDLDGRVFTRKAETPFTVAVSADSARNAEYTVRATACQPLVKMISATELELSATANLTFYPWGKCSLRVVKTVKSLGEKPCNDCALSVYIPSEGEELWSLSKRLNVCPETLLATNPDLQFPLSGEERIVIYRKR